MDVQAPQGAWLTGSRGLIMARLCAEPSTVSMLSAQLGITRTAVRGHLARLERDGLVRYTKAAGRIGKPAHVYELTGDGESLLSRGYPIVLEALLGAAESLDPGAREQLIDRAAEALAAAWPRRPGGPGAQAEAAAEVLRRLGGVAAVTRSEGTDFVVEGQCCPLRAISRGHELVCAVMESALRQALDASVREHCDRAGAPHCRFTLGAGASEGTGP